MYSLYTELMWVPHHTAMPLVIDAFACFVYIVIMCNKYCW